MPRGSSLRRYQEAAPPPAPAMEAAGGWKAQVLPPARPGPSHTPRKSSPALAALHRGLRAAPTAATTARLYIPSSIKEKKKRPTDPALLLRERRLARRPLPVSFDVVSEYRRRAGFHPAPLHALFAPMADPLH